MRIVDDIWIRPIYPDDGIALASLDSGRDAHYWDAHAAETYRAPSAKVATWVAADASGRIVGFLSGGASGSDEFCLDRGAWTSDLTRSGLEALLASVLASVARAGGGPLGATIAEPLSARLGALVSFDRGAPIKPFADADRARHSREFASMLDVPRDALLLDLSNGRDLRNKAGDWSIGRYNEKRRSLYVTPLFAGERDVHVGLDIGGPVGAPIRAFAEGEVISSGYNAAAGDYGYVIVTRHSIGGRPLFALFGHLQERSIEGRAPGTRFTRGETLAWIGDVHENGGWEHPHLHLQLSFEEPATHDMPGAVSDADLSRALRLYPDPRLVAGYIY